LIKTRNHASPSPARRCGAHTERRKTLLAIIIGIAIIALAAIILARRAIQFFRTKGRSACANCPYSGSCGGGCEKRIS